MKLVFTKSNLNKAVGIVMKAVPTRTTMNILECILIDATTNEIKFTGNDMELGIETIVEGEIIEKGKVAIDAKLFSEIVRKLPDNDITLSTDSNNNALIICEKSKFNIAGKSGEDFSYLPAIIKDKMITLSQFQLREVINQTIFSIAMNDNNKMMTGELFEISEGNLKVVGLDGHRIAIRNIKLEGRADNVPGMSAVSQAVMDLLIESGLVWEKDITIVGRGHAVKELAKYLDFNNATVTVAHSKTKSLLQATQNRDVVIYATPIITQDISYNTRDLVIDLGNSVPHPDRLNCPYVNRIGQLTVSILLNRFAKKESVWI